jgi:sugar phosphate isomerase/epimerase
MRNCLGPGTRLGYCTNVHAGPTLDAVKANLERHACAVRSRVCPDAPLGIGLWLPAPAARTVAADVEPFADWLAERGLEVFTLNGFPQGDFHQPIVKHDVYAPTWAEPARLEHTLQLARILVGLLPEDAEGSISTLPVAWRGDVREPATLDRAAAHLRAAADALARIEDETGTQLHLDLEPEPGCFMDRSADVVAFFETHLLPGADETRVRRHVRVCHDVCHAAVMFEDQAAALAAYDRAGIAIGKVHLSSALAVPFDAMTQAAGEAAGEALATFVEPRYLHQTVVNARGAARLYEDLPDALRDGERAGTWRVHFHVPVHLDRIGPLHTTRDDLLRCLELVRGGGRVRHFEVETYAWSVLPEPLRVEPLAEGIARELAWVLEAAGEGEP